ncbi:rhodanese-like domain-containing protein [Ignavigranum ruoffiae]|uniref:rhodanese-like domain-containing protein n=1 Tax=Ignavigranum ruoffiae TaxID=89093 RepID=UPI003B00FC30
MNKLSYQTLTADQPYQLVDIRQASQFRQAFVPGSINLTLNNFSNYAEGVLNRDEAIIWIIDQTDSSLIQTIEDISEGYSSIGFIEFAAFPSDMLQSVASIPAEDFLAINHTAYQLIDVRQQAEITRPAPKKNLLSIPLAQLKSQINQLNHEDKQYLLCGSGNRATTAASLLARAGMQPVVIEGGMKAVQACQSIQATISEE